MRIYTIANLLQTPVMKLFKTIWETQEKITKKIEKKYCDLKVIVLYSNTL